MERQRLSVTKRVGMWGSVYIIGGTEIDGETLPAEQADDIIARFEHEQALFGRALNCSLNIGSASAAPTHTRKPIAGFQADGVYDIENQEPRTGLQHLVLDAPSAL